MQKSNTLKKTYTPFFADKTFKCSFCKYQNISHDKIVYHENNTCWNHKCKYCNFTGTKEALKKHNELDCNETHKKCNYCKCFETRDHQEKCSSRFRYCKYCDFVEDQADRSMSHVDLFDHLRNCKKRLFHCSICGEKFNKEYVDKREHQVQCRLKKLVFKCQYCNKNVGLVRTSVNHHEKKCRERLNEETNNYDAYDTYYSDSTESEESDTQFNDTDNNDSDDD
jgi:hypothetical protein